MSKLSVLLEKPKVVTLGTGSKKIELELKPLGLDDFKKIDISNLDKPTAADMISMIQYVLKKSVPDATPEELADLPIKYMGQLGDYLSELSGMEVKGDVEQELISRVKAKSATQPAN